MPIVDGKYHGWIAGSGGFCNVVWNLPTAEQLANVLIGETVMVNGDPMGVYMGQGRLRMPWTGEIVQIHMPTNMPTNMQSDLFQGILSSGYATTTYQTPKAPKHYQPCYNSNDVSCGLQSKIRTKLKHEHTQDLDEVTCRNCLDCIELEEQERNNQPKQAVAADVLVGGGRRIVID